MLHIKSTNYDRFRCIAGACPESCCTGWQIVIDDASLERYKNIDNPEFRDRVCEAIDWEEQCFRHDGSKCILMTEDKLCSIQLAYGEQALCETCRRYPRHMEEFENVREWSLSLSCPEAARMILANTEKLEFLQNETDEVEEGEYEENDAVFYDKLAAARNCLYSIIQDRSLRFREKALVIAALSTEWQDCIDFGNLEAMEDVIANAEEMKADAIALCAGGDAAVEGNPLSKELFSKLFELEVLGEDWLDIVDKTWNAWEDGMQLSDAQEVQAEQLLMFWIYTYFCGAVYDGLVYSKAMLAVCSVWWIFQIQAANQFAGGITEAAYKYAREIEHSDENLIALEDWFDHG